MALRLRQLPALADVPIIATSASPTRDVEARCLAAGADAFIAKPIDQAALLEALGKLMGLSWIHEEPGPRIAGRGDDDHNLVYPPPEEMQVLRALAGLGNMKSIRERAEHLRGLDARLTSYCSVAAVGIRLR